MKYLSLFSGIGGFELGIQQAYEINIKHALISEESESEERPQGRVGTTHINGVQLHNRDGTAPLCIGFSEIDKYATQIYQKHFPNHKNYGDITKIDTGTLEDFDLLVGGFPCKSFSIAGKQGGFSDTRGTLFFEIARIAKAKKPRLLLLENVKGLLSHDEGRTFFTIVSTLDELGYDLQWQVLNSKNFGVPQNRERVFIIGHLRGTSRPEVFPIIGTSEVRNRPQTDKETICQTLTRRYPESRNGNYIMRDGRDNRSCLRSGRTPEIGYKGYSIRRLTPTECARLQSFPDDWHKVDGISDTQAYKCYGNAVTVNVIKEIIISLTKE